MSYTNTRTDSITFTITHARHLAAKVATDLKRMQRFYGAPTDAHIAELEEELIALLKNGYLEKVTYGYMREGNWIKPSFSYTAQELQSNESTDDDPGRVPLHADISNAFFYSYLIKSKAYHDLSYDEKQKFENSITINRVGAPTPGVTGYFSRDLSYSSGGRALNRSTLNS